MTNWHDVNYWTAQLLVCQREKLDSSVADHPVAAVRIFFVVTVHATTSTPESIASRRAIFAKVDDFHLL